MNLTLRVDDGPHWVIGGGGACGCCCCCGGGGRGGSELAVAVVLTVVVRFRPPVVSLLEAVAISALPFASAVVVVAFRPPASSDEDGRVGIAPL